MDQLPRLGKRELICLLLFTCNYVVSVWRGFLFLLVLGMGYVILLWHSLSLPLIILRGSFSHVNIFMMINSIPASNGVWFYFNIPMTALRVIRSTANTQTTGQFSLLQVRMIDTVMKNKVPSLLLHIIFSKVCFFKII